MCFRDSGLAKGKMATECVIDLDNYSKMTIFVSILTTFIASVIFRGSWGNRVNWLEPKTEPP